MVTVSLLAAPAEQNGLRASWQLGIGGAAVITNYGAHVLLCDHGFIYIHLLLFSQALSYSNCFVGLRGLVA